MTMTCSPSYLSIMMMMRFTTAPVKDAVLPLPLPSNQLGHCLKTDIKYCSHHTNILKRRSSRIWRPVRGRTMAMARVRLSDPPNSTHLQSTVDIPVTCYQILGVTCESTKDQVVKAAIDLKDSVIDDGYSPSVFPARQELLVDVRDKLLFETDYGGNAKANVPPKSVLTIPLPWLPAALSLLQEVGEEKVAMEIGRMHVQQAKAKPYIHDILLSMSLAECSIARKSFERGTVSQGFEALARAQLLLRSKKSLSKLTLLAEIEDSLEELAPSCLLENLSLPRLAENGHRREGALAALRELLRQGLDAEHTCCVKDWPSFLDQVMKKLLAVEIVGLLQWDSLAQIRRDHYSSEAKQQRNVIDYNCFYTALLAHIALAFSRKCPELIQSSKKIIEGLERSEAVSLDIETTVCKVLLGEVIFDNQKRLNGVSRNEVQQGASKGADRGVGDAYAPLEKWLKEAALGIFVDTRDSSASLVHYFGTIKKISTNAWSRNADVYHNTDSKCKPSSHICSQVRSLSSTNPVEALTSYPSSGEVTDDQGQVSSTSTENSSIFNNSKSLSSLKLRQNIGVSRKIITGGFKSSELAGKLIFFAFLAGSAFAICKWNSQADSIPFLPLNCSLQQVSHISTLNFLSNLNKKSKNSMQKNNPGNILAGIGNTISQHLVPVPQEGQTEKDSWPVNDLSLLIRKREGDLFHRKQMSYAEAEGLVSKWQRTKSHALGPNHEMQLLPEILAEPMLSQWQALAKSAKSSSCYWRFMLLHLSIVHAEILSDDMGWEVAEVEAVLEEAAELIGGSKNKNPNYYSTYHIIYVLKRASDGKWKFVGGGIQSPV